MPYHTMLTMPHATVCIRWCVSMRVCALTHECMHAFAPPEPLDSATEPSSRRPRSWHARRGRHCSRVWHCLAVSRRVSHAWTFRMFGMLFWCMFRMLLCMCVCMCMCDCAEVCIHAEACGWVRAHGWWVHASVACPHRLVGRARKNAHACRYSSGCVCLCSCACVLVCFSFCAGA